MKTLTLKDGLRVTYLGQDEDWIGARSVSDYVLLRTKGAEAPENSVLQENGFVFRDRSINMLHKLSLSASSGGGGVYMEILQSTYTGFTRTGTGTACSALQGIILKTTCGSASGQSRT